MDKDEIMEIERRRYIAASVAGDRDWATQNDPQEVLHKIGTAVLRYEWTEAREILKNAIIAAADSHVQQMDDLGRFDDVDIIADLKAAATDMQSLAESIRNVK